MQNLSINNLSNQLKGVANDKFVQLGGTKGKEGAKLGNHDVKVLDTAPSATENRETREALLNSFKASLGETKWDRGLLEGMRQRLCPSSKDAEKPVKALEARAVVNIARAQGKNAQAMLDTALCAVKDNVPSDVMTTLRLTIRNHPNHPNVIAFLDTYGNGSRDLKLLQRVCDLALQQKQSQDSRVNAYLEGFRGNERAEAVEVAMAAEAVDYASLGRQQFERQAAEDAKLAPKPDTVPEQPAVVVETKRAPEQTKTPDQTKTSEQTKSGSAEPVDQQDPRLKELLEVKKHLVPANELKWKPKIEPKVSDQQRREAKLSAAITKRRKALTMHEDKGEDVEVEKKSELPDDIHENEVWDDDPGADAALKISEQIEKAKKLSEESMERAKLSEDYLAGRKKLDAMFE